MKFPVARRRGVKKYSFFVSFKEQGIKPIDPEAHRIRDQFGFASQFIIVSIITILQI